MSTTHSNGYPAPTTDDPPTADRCCDHCGAVIDTSDWYPVTNDRAPDGSLRIFSFDSEDCQDAFEAA